MRPKTGITTPGHIEPASKDNERELHSPQSSRNLASSSDVV